MTETLSCLCRFSSGITTKPIYRQINTQKAVREINSVMLDAYLDGVNYFRLVLTNGTLGTGFESVARLDRLPVRQHGVIAEVSSSTSALAALSFSSQHFDIFGWFLPLESPSVMMASQIVCDLYASRGWLHVFRGASDVTNSAWPNASIAQEHLNTLDRYIINLRFYVKFKLNFSAALDDYLKLNFCSEHLQTAASKILFLILLDKAPVWIISINCFISI